MDWMTFVAPIENPIDVPAEYLIERVRSWRKAELAATDYTQLSDSPVQNKIDWATYRQELRNLPEQGADPRQWIFPARPE